MVQEVTQVDLRRFARFVYYDDEIWVRHFGSHETLLEYYLDRVVRLPRPARPDSKLGVTQLPGSEPIQPKSGWARTGRVGALSG